MQREYALHKPCGCCVALKAGCTDVSNFQQLLRYAIAVQE